MASMTLPSHGAPRTAYVALQSARLGNVDAAKIRARLVAQVRIDQFRFARQKANDSHVLQLRAGLLLRKPDAVDDEPFFKSRQFLRLESVKSRRLQLGNGRRQRLGRSRFRMLVFGR